MCNLVNVKKIVEWLEHWNGFIFYYIQRKIRSFVDIRHALLSVHDFESIFVLYSPANKILPINSFRPILSKSITITSKEHSRIFSHGTLKLNDSLKTGLSVQLNIGVFRFSTRLSPNCSHTLTYGSERIFRMDFMTVICLYYFIHVYRIYIYIL